MLSPTHSFDSVDHAAHLVHRRTGRGTSTELSRPAARPAASSCHPASPIHHTSKHTAPRSSTSHRPESPCQCASRQMSPPCVADYPILFITCATRRRGPWTTKPPLFTSLDTTPTRPDCLSLPSSLLPTTTPLLFPSHQPIAFQKRRTSRRS